ncbi:MAG: type ISP restriction/modification enzyme [Chloroflexota bacterium]
MDSLKTAQGLRVALDAFAQGLTSSFSSPIRAQPEDQLKSPVQTLLKRAGELIGRSILVRFEAQVADLHGRPDLAIEVDELLGGFVELKAPGKGARPERFSGDDLKQWRKFQSLPNVIYTDGNEWGLYRTGKRVGEVVRLAGDVTSDGVKAITGENVTLLDRLFRDFLSWGPVVPASPRALAEVLAPLCRILREDAFAAVKKPDSALAGLAAEWRQYLFSGADDDQFADAYAQTVTYALLLARLEGLATPQDLKYKAAEVIEAGHGLLAGVLGVLRQPAARKELEVPIALLERAIAAVDPSALDRLGSPWLYFYEDFLAKYDEDLRKRLGVYYTPPPVVGVQVRLVAQLLEERFQKRLAFADDGVVFLDPAAGTGAYPLAALELGFERVRRVYGPGAVGGRATVAAENCYAFEILVGPYAVAHLRLTQRILAEGGALPQNGVHMYLADTLESPNAPAQPPLPDVMHRRLAEEAKLARDVKANTRVLVCLGNPPYDRHAAEDKQRGGWVRLGDERPGNSKPDAIFEDFLAPARASGAGVHLKNLYNLYVYFWRWALWKVLESSGGPGIISFITASSYLKGPGFVGMRRLMRSLFDELWIIDLEGSAIDARKSENVFAIQNPVAIAVGVRYAASQPDKPAVVHYYKVEGTRTEKLGRLAEIGHFADAQWQDCFSGWPDPFLPTSQGNFFSWPLMTDLFPWQHSGVQFKRKWPIGVTLDVLTLRWKKVIGAAHDERAVLFGETRDRKVGDSYPSAEQRSSRLAPLASLTPGSEPEQVNRYGYRSFDRQWALYDARLGDFLRPDLYAAHGPAQVYMTSLLTGTLGEGPAATVTALLPDLDHFRGSFGAKHVIPLWRDREAMIPNVAAGLLEQLSGHFGLPISAEDLFAYCYALLSSPNYTARFAEELSVPGPRIPLTKDAVLFTRAVERGRKLVYLHTFGERMAPPGGAGGGLPDGLARCIVGVPSNEGGYPAEFSYDPATQTLHVGAGQFMPVAPEVWGFSVSGLQVLPHWLAYRMKDGAGRSSSELDKIRPTTWPTLFTEELLRVLGILEATVKMWPELEVLLQDIVAAEVFSGAELPQPTELEHKPPAVERVGQMTLGL